MKKLIFLLLLLLIVTPCFGQDVARMSLGVVGGGTPATGGSPPTLTSSTVAAAGTTVSLLFSESVSVGAGGNGGWTLTTIYPAVTLAYASGSGSTTLVYTPSRTITECESMTINYTQPGNGIEATTGGTDVATLTGATVTDNSTQVDSASGYLIAQNFETCTDGTGDCDAWATTKNVTLDNSELWTATLGTNGTVSSIDTTSPILRQCKQLKFYGGDNAASTNISSPAFTAQDTVYVHFKYRIATSVPGTSQPIMYFQLSTAAKMWVMFLTTGTLQISIGAKSATTVGTLAADTTYHIWAKYVKGTGANGVGSVAFSTNTTEPTSGDNFATFTDGTQTAQVDNIELRGPFLRTSYFDQVIVDDAPIVPLAP